MIGPEIMGQNFTKPEYFHPSSAGSGYDPTSSAGSQLEPASAKLIKGVTKKDDKENEVADFVAHYALDDDVAYESSIPLENSRTPAVI